MGFQYCPRCGTKLVEEIIDGHERKRCCDSDCGYVHFNNPTPVVAAVVSREEHVVLIQNEGWPDHWYGLVSGFLEPEEDPESAIIREIEEELRVQGSLKDLIGVYPFQSLNQVLIVYHVSISSEPKIGDELADLKRIPVEDVQPWDVGTGLALADWLDERGIPYTVRSVDL